MTDRPLVLITGAARSGTSMVAGVLHACGLDLGGPLVKPTQWNPGGFFEHKAIRQKVMKPLLKKLGCDPRGQAKLPPRMMPFHDANRLSPSLRRNVLRRLGSGRGYKDAKILLTWQIWKRAFQGARWVIVRRDPQAIVASCMRTPFMRKRQGTDGWARWVQEHEFRIADLRASGVEYLEIWPNPSDPESFREVVEFAGCEWDAEAVQAFLNPKAWHQQKGAE